MRLGNGRAGMELDELQFIAGAGEQRTKAPGPFVRDVLQDDGAFHGRHEKRIVPASAGIKCSEQREIRAPRKPPGR